MKVRTCFVSNSSTSSYCVFGVRTSEKELIKVLCGGKEKEPQKYQNCKHKFDRDSMKFCPECGQAAWSIDNSSWGWEDWDEILSEHNMCVRGDEYDLYVGTEITGYDYDRLVKLQATQEKIKEMFQKMPKVHNLTLPG